jgi:hypothetical protein
MAKRSRGSVRPGQRRATVRRPASSAASSAAPTAAGSTATPTPKPAGLSEAEIARAAQLEAAMLAEEKAAEDARRRTRERGATRELGAGSAGSFAAQEAIEYAYVARDVKDIVRIAALLIGILIVLYILIDVLKVIPIGG